MEAIQEHKGLVYPLNRTHIDTDQIIPKQFLKRIERTGFGEFVFYNWRFDDDGNLREDFDMNHDKYKDASILLTGENFGCGSSREHAPWALLDYGFKVIIAPSFADIFYNNAMKNGIILIKMEENILADWMTRGENGELYLDIDLEKQIIIDEEENKTVSFDIPAHHKEKLLNGWDDIAITMQLQDKITAYENKYQNK